MPTRRNFLQSAAVLSASPLAPKIVFANGGESAALDALIIDSRHRDARAFGLRAAQWGAPLRKIEGDVTGLWYHELDARWKSGPAAVAGLTERPALFLLERLAWDHNLRVVFEGEHELKGAGVVTHHIARSANRNLTSQLEAAGAAWPITLADQLLTGSRVTARDFRPSGASMAAQHDESTKLYSWIIAPRSAE